MGAEIKMRFWCWIGLLNCLPLIAHGEIVSDGTLGAVQSLSGPDFHIGAELGQQAGNNLFHSFSTFNLHLGESATFSGPDAIANVITRVTGGKASQLNGVLRATMPNAEVYFLNPYGILFGSEFTLDVPGSFHASTADYLRLGEKAYFYADTQQVSQFHSDPPQAFGFLDKPVAGISVKGRGEITVDDLTTNLSASSTNELRILNEPTQTGLHLKAGGTLSLIGGDLSISQGTYLPEYEVSPNGSIITGTTYVPLLSAEAGRIHLVAVAGAGEVVIGEAQNPKVTELGNIQLSGKSFLSTSGESGGTILLRAGEIEILDSKLNTSNFGNKDSDGGLDIHAENIYLSEDTHLEAVAHSTGKGGDIHLHAGELLQLSDKNGPTDMTTISVQTFGQGTGGTLSVTAKNIEILGNSLIANQSQGEGDSGDLMIQAERIALLGDNDFATNNAKGINGGLGKTAQDAHGGDIVIETGDLILTQGMVIRQAVVGQGEPGKLKILASGTVTVKGADSSKGFSSAIVADSVSAAEVDESGTPIKGSSAGKAGNIDLHVHRLVLEDGGRIAANSTSPGAIGSSAGAGEVHVQAEHIEIRGVNPYGRNNDGFGSGIYSQSFGETAGDGGTITINTQTLTLEDGGIIHSGTNNASNAGDLHITVGGIARFSGDSADIALLEAGQSQSHYQHNPSYSGADEANFSSSGLRSSSQSQLESGGKGGIIELSAGQLILEKGAGVSSQSNGGGLAGNIQMVIQGAVQLSNAVISTESASSGGGQIDITADGLIHLRTAKITTSVRGGKENGGNINLSNIAAPLVLNRSRLIARADAGHGGDIDLRTRALLQSTGTIVDASSHLGIDGTVETHEAEHNGSDSIFTISGQFLRGDAFSQNFCEGTTGLAELSRFSYDTQAEGSHQSPESLLH
ncbi:haemagglutination activity domain protein [Candidatus Venteria ishoeyi]|uniref:Haemagglutination activity domain protein n=2 Tax=Candidatus Venteria ishoeyi TaxID=1899563 RepID=A0A1H6FG29_9GAMM|nr:haemagglutination activity domain protein [Candidatus Venteria ishoeyi]